jgi:hypothetical protein
MLFDKLGPNRHIGKYRDLQKRKVTKECFGGIIKLIERITGRKENACVD